MIGERITDRFSGLTAERARDLLSYDRDTGLFTWRHRMGGYAEAGTVAGALKRDGYRRIQVDGRLFAAHRLAWLYIYGEFPNQDIDHKNLNRDDNRIENLRLATRPQNIANTKVRVDNVSGLRGVTKRREGTYMARVTINGNRQYLGSFQSAEDAHAAYVKVASKFYAEFHRV